MSKQAPIAISNRADETVSWFCYNSNDSLKLIALKSGTLSTGETYYYAPPKNGTGLYFVRFTKSGGGTELAGSIVAPGQTITLLGSNGHYYSEVSDGISASEVTEEVENSTAEVLGS